MTKDVSPPIWDEAIRLDYPLDSNSIVMDAGAYEGAFAQKIFDKFGCKVILLEPVTVFCANCIEKFKGNRQIEVYNVGIGAEVGEATIFVNKDASSRFVTAGQSETAMFRPLSNMMAGLQIDGIDLLKLNIEGAEYAVLENIITSKLINQIRFIQVQFHQESEYSPERLENLRTALSKTHDCSWRWSPMTWESWERR